MRRTPLTSLFAAAVLFSLTLAAADASAKRAAPKDEDEDESTDETPKRPRAKAKAEPPAAGWGMQAALGYSSGFQSSPFYGLSASLEAQYQLESGLLLGVGGQWWLGRELDTVKGSAWSGYGFAFVAPHELMRPR